MNESKGSKKCYDDMNESLRRRIQFFFERIEFSFLKVRGFLSLGLSSARFTGKAPGAYPRRWCTPTGAIPDLLSSLDCDGTEIRRVENGR